MRDALRAGTAAGLRAKSEREGAGQVCAPDRRARADARAPLFAASRLRTHVCAESVYSGVGPGGGGGWGGVGCSRVGWGGDGRPVLLF